MTLLTKKDVMARINAFCDKFDTFAEAAAALRCTASQLSQARLGKTGLIPAPILKKLKIKAVTRYESNEPPPKPHRKAVARAAAKPSPTPAKKPTPPRAKPQPAGKALPARPEKGDIASPLVKVIAKKHRTPSGAPARAVSKPAALGVGYGTKITEAGVSGDPYANVAKVIYADEVSDDADSSFEPQHDMPGTTFSVFDGD
jgi:hypothetical protein